jgi:hypothetical protein
MVKESEKHRRPHFFSFFLKKTHLCLFCVRHGAVMERQCLYWTRLVVAEPAPRPETAAAAQKVDARRRASGSGRSHPPRRTSAFQRP